MDYTSRKFILAGSAMAATISFTAVGILSGGEFIGALGVILGLYGGANVMEKRVG